MGETGRTWNLCKIFGKFAQIKVLSIFHESPPFSPKASLGGFIFWDGDSVVEEGPNWVDPLQWFQPFHHLAKRFNSSRANEDGGFAAADPRLDRILMALLKPQGFQEPLFFFVKIWGWCPEKVLSLSQVALLTNIMDDGWITLIESIPNKSMASTVKRSLTTALIYTLYSTCIKLTESNK